MGFELTEQVLRRAGDDIGWLSTVTPSGKPAPRPVWFVLDGQTYWVFSQPGAAKVRHIEQNPNVSLHFNSTADGFDVLVVTGTAELVADGPKASEAPGFLDKYAHQLPNIGSDVQKMDAEYSTPIRITPTRSWGFS